MKKITQKYLKEKGFSPNGHNGFVIQFSKFDNWGIYEPENKIFAIAGERSCTTEHGFQVKIKNINDLEKWILFLELQGHKILKLKPKKPQKYGSK